MNAPILESLAVPARSPCLIVNVRSFRASRGELGARAIEVAKAHGADVLEAENPAALRFGLDRVLQEGPRPLYVLAGDGTVQALMDELAARFAPGALPPVLALGGGRTNLIAGDVGGCGDVLEKLDAALGRYRRKVAFEVQDRAMLVIEQAPAPPRHGFFVAGGLIDEAIRDCHRHREAGSGPLRRGHFSTPWYLLKLAVLALLGRSPISSPRLDIDARGLGRLLGPMQVVIATTLLHREGLFNPYAARGAGPLRITAVIAGAQRFWRSLPRLLMGRFTERLGPAQGYLSGGCEAIEVLGLRGYALDGEEFDTDPTRPVTIRSGPTVGFLRP